MLLKATDYSLFVIGTVFLFFFSSTLRFENYLFNVKPIIFIIFIIFIILNAANLSNYLFKILRENYRSLDFFIIIAILLHFLIQGRINFYGVSFLAIYVFISSLSPYIGKSNAKIYKLILNCIFFSGMISLTGVYLGLLESLFLDTNYLHQYQPPGYPSPTSDLLYKIIGFRLSNHISGFQTSINYSAYIIISCLGILNFLQCKPILRKILQILLFAGLLLTQAKIGFLFITILIVMSVSKKFQKPIGFFLIFSTCICYLLLTHITIIDSNSLIVSEKYYREFVFSFMYMDFYLSLFSWLKILSLNYLFSSSIFLMHLSEFFKLSEGNEPHSLFISSFLFGGPIFALLITLRLIKNLLKYFLLTIERNVYFSTSLCVFFVESIIWDSYDAPIFWLIVLLAPYFHYKNNIISVPR